MYVYLGQFRRFRVHNYWTRNRTEQRRSDAKLLTIDVMSSETFEIPEQNITRSSLQSHLFCLLDQVLLVSKVRLQKITAAAAS